MTKQVYMTDSDFLISLIKEDDSNHGSSIKIANKLNLEGARVLYPVSAIIEAATALSRRYNQPKLAQQLLKTYRNPDIEVVGVDVESFVNSINFFNPDTTKQDTPFDSLILSLANQYKVDGILSFDSYFKDQGYKTAKDLVEMKTR